MKARFVRPAVTLLLVMTGVLGVAYPLVITGVARVTFPTKPRELIYKDGHLIGSTLIGQSFSDPKYFWAGRPPPHRNLITA